MSMENSKKLIAEKGLRHVAFIMDGNGRWAKKRGLPREFGHKTGADTFKKVISYCFDCGIECVTVYAFSTENWKRSEKEVTALMSLFSTFIDNASMANAEFVAEATSAGSKVVEDIFGKSANTVEKQLDALVGVEAGTYDVAVLDASLASQYVQNKDGAYNGKLKVLDIAGVEPEYYAIGFREGSNLADVFNNVLAGLYADGVAKTVAERYAQDGVLYNGFGEYDANYQLPTDGDYAYVKENGKIVIGYTIFSPMAYFPE